VLGTLKDSGKSWEILGNRRDRGIPARKPQSPFSSSLSLLSPDRERLVALDVNEEAKERMAEFAFSMFRLG